MKWLTYGWAIFANLFCVVIVLIVFSKIEDRNTVLIVAAIGLVYTALRGLGLGTAIYYTTVFPTLMLAINDIRVAVVPGFQREANEQNEVEKAKLNALIKAWIQGCGLGIISLICLYQFFSVL